MTKKSTKFLSAVLVLVMIVTLTVPAFAADRPQRTSYSYTTVNVGAYQVQVSDFWKQDTSVDYYRSFAEKDSSIVSLNIQQLFKDLDSDILYALSVSDPDNQLTQSYFDGARNKLAELSTYGDATVVSYDSAWTASYKYIYYIFSSTMSGVPITIYVLLYNCTGVDYWLSIMMGYLDNSLYKYDDAFFDLISHIKPKPAAGQVIGQVLATDIKAYINGVEIPAYNIDGKLAVLVSDLNNYGFTTNYNDQLRKSTITKNSHILASEFVPLPSKSSGLPIGTPVMSVYSTDITVELEGRSVTAFNVDNRMAIYFTELQVCGLYGYDDYSRASYLNLQETETLYAAPEPQMPERNTDVTVPAPVMPLIPTEETGISYGSDSGADDTVRDNTGSSGSTIYDSPGNSGYSGSSGDSGSYGSSGADSHYDNPYLSYSSSGMDYVVNMETGKIHKWGCRYVKGNYDYPRMYTDDPYGLMDSDSFFSFCGWCD